MKKWVIDFYEIKIDIGVKNNKENRGYENVEIEKMSEIFVVPLIPQKLYIINIIF